MDFDAFFAELTRRLSSCMKQGYVPSGQCIAEIVDMLPDVDASFFSEEIIPRMPHYGLQMVDVEEEDYLPAGTPEEEIGRKLLGVIREKGHDPDEIYAQGVERLAKNYKELFDALCNITYFAVPGCSIGLNCMQNTWRILRPVLKGEHLRLHPEKAADEEPWVDEETIEFLRPYVKLGCVPSWAVDKAMQLLVIDLGHYPLSEDVLVTTMQAVGVVSMPIAREYWLPNGTDEAMIRMNLRRILQDTKTDVERACRDGIAAINQDILSICRNMILFALDTVESVDHAGFRTGQILMDVLLEERQRFHVEALDDDESFEPDEEMAQDLRTYAKGGLVPGWVVGEHYQRLLEKHQDIGAAAGIRDATLHKLALSVVLMEKEYYIAPGASQDEMDDRIEAVIEKWDMEKCFGSDVILPEYDSAFQQIVAALFFADPDFDTREEAAGYFMSELLDYMTRYRIRNYPDDVPQAGLDALEAAIEPFCKNDMYPSFAAENAVRCIVPYVKHRWYAERLVWHLLGEKLDLSYYELPEEFYVEPEQDDEKRLDRLADVMLKLRFDLRYIAENETVSEEDEDKLEIFTNAILFADPEIEFEYEAEREAKSYLMVAAERFQ